MHLTVSSAVSSPGVYSSPLPSRFVGRLAANRPFLELRIADPRSALMSRPYMRSYDTTGPHPNAELRPALSSFVTQSIQPMQPFMNAKLYPPPCLEWQLAAASGTAYVRNRSRGIKLWLIPRWAPMHFFVDMFVEETSAAHHRELCSDDLPVRHLNILPLVVCPAFLMCSKHTQFIQRLGVSGLALWFSLFPNLFLFLVKWAVFPLSSLDISLVEPLYVPLKLDIVSYKPRGLSKDIFRQHLN